METQEKVVINGEPVQGPQEKAGSDHVQAKLSYFDLGVEHAADVSKTDERITRSRQTIREALCDILKSPEEAWPTYTDGMKSVLDKRKEKNLPTASLGVLRSQVVRVFNSAKRSHSTTVAALNNSKLNWKEVLKALPRADVTGKGAPSTKDVAVPTEVSVETESNVGTLIQLIDGAAKRLVQIGREKNAPFAAYMGMNILEFSKIAREDFQRIYAEFNVGGVIKDHDGYLIALGLMEKPKAVPVAAEVAAEVPAAEIPAAIAA